MAETKRRCTARNKVGGRCGNPAEPGSELCFTHAGKRDMRELGRHGGIKSGRVRRGLAVELVEDDDLRERARVRLRQMLDSDDEKTRLAAARSLFSYSSAPAPRDDGETDASASAMSSWRSGRRACQA